MPAALNPGSGVGCYRCTGWVVMAGAVATTLAGCAVYHAKPLSAEAVAQAQQPAPIEAVRIAAARLEHPLVKAMTIDGSGGYTPDEIAVMAVIVSPQLRALRDQRGLAQAQVVQAGILPNPQLGQSADVPRGNADPTLVTGRNLGFSWDLSALLTRHDDVAAARAAAQSVDLQVAWQEWQLAQDARLRAYRIASVQERLPLAREIEDGLAANLQATRTAFAHGNQVTADLTTATNLLAQAQVSRLALEQGLVVDRVALNLTLGLPAAAPLLIKDGASLPALDADADTTTALLDGIDSRRLDLVALKMGYQSQEHALRSAILAQVPKIGLSVNKANDTSDIRTRGSAVTVDLPLFDRHQGAIAAARATRQQLFDEYLLRVAEARAQVQQILEDLALTRTELATASDSLADLRQLAVGYDKAFAGQHVDVIAYRDARAALATRQIEQGKLKQDLLELGVALEIATGRALLTQTITRNPTR